MPFCTDFTFFTWSKTFHFRFVIRITAMVRSIILKKDLILRVVRVQAKNKNVSDLKSRNRTFRQYLCEYNLMIWVMCCFWHTHPLGLVLFLTPPLSRLCCFWHTHPLKVQISRIQNVRVLCKMLPLGNSMALKTCKNTCISLVSCYTRSNVSE